MAWHCQCHHCTLIPKQGNAHNSCLYDNQLVSVSLQWNSVLDQFNYIRLARLFPVAQKPAFWEQHNPCTIALHVDISYVICQSGKFSVSRLSALFYKQIIQTHKFIQVRT